MHSIKNTYTRLTRGPYYTVPDMLTTFSCVSEVITLPSATCKHMMHGISSGYFTVQRLHVVGYYS